MKKFLFFYYKLFPRIIAGGDNLRQGDYSREAIISKIATGSRALNIVFYYPIKSKNYHIK